MTKNEIIPIAYDRAFKKIFGSIEGIERCEYFLSEYLGISYNKIKGKVKILSNELPKENKRSKNKIIDLLTEVKLKENEYLINIELNLFRKSIKRNIIYICKIASGSIHSRGDYQKMPKILQINFDGYEIDQKSKRIVKRYYFKNEENHILDEGIEIDHINLEKCIKLWYDGDINKASKKDQKIIKLGIMLYMKDHTEIEGFIEGENMAKKIKESIINAINEYNYDNIERLYYDKEKEDLMIKQEDMELARKEAKQEGFQEGKHEGFQEGIQEGIQQGINQSALLITQKMLDEKIPIEIITKVTGLSKSEIEKINTQE